MGDAAAPPLHSQRSPVRTQQQRWERQAPLLSSDLSSWRWKVAHRVPDGGEGDRIRAVASPRGIMRVRCQIPPARTLLIAAAFAANPASVRAQPAPHPRPQCQADACVHEADRQRAARAQPSPSAPHQSYRGRRQSAPARIGPSCPARCAATTTGATATRHDPGLSRWPRPIWAPWKLTWDPPISREGSSRQRKIELTEIKEPRVA